MALRRAIQFAGLGAGATVAIGAAGLYMDAPVADDGSPEYVARHAATRDRLPALFYNAARATILFFPATLVSKVYLGMLNTVSMKNEDALAQWIIARPRHRALITVTNHSSTVDDPALFACLLPWSCANPRLSRWGLCSQEYCYTKGPLLSALFYGSKTLPIKRGAGIDHPMLMDLFKKVQEGEWVHVFPEGKIVQGGRLGQREDKLQKEIGGLKWGVGKLIARAEETPIVIPIYHLGLDSVMPQNANHKLKSMIPRIGQRVHARVGEPIYFDDLFVKYAEDRVQGIEGQDHTWVSLDKERQLYSAITRRIEEALLALEAQCYEDLNQLK
ncbi:tafazzin-like protein [Achlya hypogyna]|uniref:Tafazzin family protein n=1 Tax=Achlya hypogyna TaxID=1202772 RepID=A0A1V9YC99_ACHHY|nr:tafazzin-like protein [Achlya hypogyna]